MWARVSPTRNETNVQCTLCLSDLQTQKHAIQVKPTNRAPQNYRWCLQTLVGPFMCKTPASPCAWLYYLRCSLLFWSMGAAPSGAENSQRPCQGWTAGPMTAWVLKAGVVTLP